MDSNRELSIPYRFLLFFKKNITFLFKNVGFIVVNLHYCEDPHYYLFLYLLSNFFFFWYIKTQPI